MVKKFLNVFETKPIAPLYPHWGHEISFFEINWNAVSDWAIWSGVASLLADLASLSEFDAAYFM